MGTGTGQPPTHVSPAMRQVIELREAEKARLASTSSAALNDVIMKLKDAAFRAHGNLGPADPAAFSAFKEASSLVKILPLGERQQAMSQVLNAYHYAGTTRGGDGLSMAGESAAVRAYTKYVPKTVNISPGESTGTQAYVPPPVSAHTEQMANKAAKTAEPVNMSQAVKGFAAKHGMSEKAAAETLGRFRVAPQATEFKNLPPEVFNQLNEVAEKNFRETTVKLADNKYMLIKDFNELPDKYKSIGIRQGYTKMAKTMKSDLVRDVSKAYGEEYVFRTAKEQYDKTLKELEPFKVKEPTARYEYPSGGAPFEYYENLKQYDLSAALRKGINPEALKQLFPPETIDKALEFNKEQERAAKQEMLYREQLWRNVRTQEVITGAKFRGIKGRERDDYVKEMPALILPADPKWQKLKGKPATDPERQAYLEKWHDKVVDTAMFAATVATPYTLGGIGWLGRAAMIPQTGARAIRTAAAIYNIVPRIATSIAQLVALAPPAYTVSRLVDQAYTTQLQTDWQKFEGLSKSQKNRLADEAGYPPNYDKLTNEQKAVVLLNYSKPPDAAREEWQSQIAGKLDKMQKYASKGASWIQDKAPAPISAPLVFVGGAIVGVIEGAGYAASIPLLGSMLGASVPRGTAGQLSKNVGTGMAQFFTTVLPAAIRSNPALASGRITGLFILSPAAVLKLGKGGLARLSPRYVPERAMASEYSTIRLHFEKAGELIKLSPKERMRLTEKAVADLLAGKKEVKIAGSKVTMTVKNVPYQKVIGNTLWHYTTDIGKFKGRTSIKGQLFTSPQAAIRFGIMSAKGMGTLGRNTGLVEIRVPDNFKPKMEKLLKKGEAEVESIFGKDTVLEPIPGWTGKGISANVKTGPYPIRRFTILGTKTAVKALTPARLAQIRVLAAKEALVDTFLGWHGRMQVIRHALGKDPKVSRIERSIKELEAETPETTGKHGEITNLRKPVPHPTGKGTIKPRVTAVVRNNAGDIMLVKDVTEQSFGLPGGQIALKYKPGQLGFKTLPGGRRVLTFEGAAHGQVKSETGIGLERTRYLDIYLGKVNEHALSGSRIYEAPAQTEKFKLKTKEIKDAVWWDGESDITVYPATYDILKGLAKKYRLDMSRVKVDKNNPILNKARDKAIADRLANNKPVKEATITEINKAEIQSLKRQMSDINKGESPELSDWVTAEGPIRSLAELLHGRRQAVKISMSPGIKAKAAELLKRAGKTKDPAKVKQLREEAKEAKQQAEAEVRRAERELAEFYDEYGRNAYRSDFYAGRYAYWLSQLARATGAARAEPPRADDLTREYVTEIARNRPGQITPYEYKVYPGLGDLKVTPIKLGLALFDIEEPTRPIGRAPAHRRGLPSRKRGESVPEKREKPAPRISAIPVPKRVVPPGGEIIPTGKPTEPKRPPPPPPPPTTKITEIEDSFKSLGVSPSKEAREKLQSAKGAIAWRMGSLGKNGKKRDVWHVITHPYKSKDDYLILVGKRPAGVGIIAKGKQSAYRTAQTLFGIPPSRALRIDIGRTDALITRRGKDIAISFKGDPHLTTTGDITIGKSRKAFPLPKI